MLDMDIVQRKRYVKIIFNSFAIFVASTIVLELLLFGSENRFPTLSHQLGIILTVAFNCLIWGWVLSGIVAGIWFFALDSQNNYKGPASALINAFTVLPMYMAVGSILGFPYAIYNVVMLSRGDNG